MPASPWIAALEAWVGYFGYPGVFLALLLGSLGVPIPEEMPIVAAGVLSHGGLLKWWLALPVCVAGVLSGDLVLYWTGWHWGERVLNWRVVRWVLTPQREVWLKDAYCRHAVKTIVTVRHVMGLRAAAFLTAGIARVPWWKFVLADASAAIVGVPFSFGLAYFFTDQIGAILADVHRVERWLLLLGLLVLGGLVTGGVIRWNCRVSKALHVPAPREDAATPELARPLGAGMVGADPRAEEDGLEPRSCRRRSARGAILYARRDLMADYVREVMTANPQTLPTSATAREAAETMRANDIGDVITIDDKGDIVGIVTDRDIVVRVVAEGRDPRATRIEDISSRELTVVSPDDRVELAVELMRVRALRRLPAVERGKIVGIVSIGDLAVARDSRSTLADISAAPPNT